MDRRQFLRGAGCGLAMSIGVGVAGCTDGPGNNGPSDPTETTEQPTATMTPRSGPESAVETYLLAVDEGDSETVEASVHPESPIDPDADVDLETELTVREVDQREIRAVFRRQRDLEGEELEQAVERQERQFEELADEMGFQEVVYVYFSIDADGDREEGQFIVVKDGGTWFIWQ